MNASIGSFETERLIVERISKGDLADVCRLHNDPRVMKTLSADGDVLSDETTLIGLEQDTEHWRQQGYGMWIFRAKAGREFIGRGGLKQYALEGQIEVGLASAVLSDDWNRGFATEMAAACLRVGFEQLGFSEIASWTLPINRASQRVMEKLGFRYERDFTFAGLWHRFYRLSRAD